MRSPDLLRFNLRLLTGQWFRTLMTLLATAVGVAAVLLLTGMGEGARRFVLEEFNLLGNDVLIVLPGRKETTGGIPPLTGEGTRDLTLGDAEALLGLPGVRAVAPLVVGLTQVEGGGRNRELVVVGTSVELFHIRQLYVSQGRLLPETPLDQAEPVCMIGPEVRRSLFDQQPVLGRWLRTGDRRCRIIGVLEDRGVSLGTDMNDTVIIPVASAQQLFNTEGLFRLFVQVQHLELLDSVKEEVLELIQRRHQGERDVTLITQDSLLGVFDDVLKLLTLAVGAIAAISLVVAGILIMNITLISVSQRTSEIGLLKALGASERQVHRLFLSEALIMTLIGAFTGVVAGYALLWTGHWLWPQFPVSVPLWALIGAVLLAIGVALLFAWLPARKAARVPPVLALKGISDAHR
ncbi:ABC transporter permease [Marinobacterium sediminicola]|uniref:ABC transport system permease protein n=1 Tax=Marinobacterium sediminicola TaxID=518898 RepID=A0ABY1S3Y3_9GAMM|nr:ABC transporter permease [Marinobacterium sediminicola]ULG69849.1 ABC transporter permease [Marinobacterium sediminicola]SMR77871.1 putative ABC transport system permease protein [Marinobacterium sediminicola]